MLKQPKIFCLSKFMRIVQLPRDFLGKISVEQDVLMSKMLHGINNGNIILVLFTIQFRYFQASNNKGSLVVSSRICSWVVSLSLFDPLFIVMKTWPPYPPTKIKINQLNQNKFCVFWENESVKNCEILMGTFPNCNSHHCWQ